MAYNEDNETIINKAHKELAEQEKSNYIQLCRQVITKYVEDNTGDSSSVEIGRINVFADSIIPQIDYVLESGSDFKVFSDRMPVTFHHTLIAEKDEMLARMALQQRNNLNDNETRANIENSLAEGDYGAIMETTEVYENPMMWIYYSQCDECNGVGSHQCPVCHGYGNIICHKCGGNGRVSCASCAGKGHINGATCGTCGGTGITTCDKCRGIGQLTCARCNGSGQLRCEHCAGTGWLTTMGRTYVKAIPSYSINYLRSFPEFFKNSVKKIGVNNIHRCVALKQYDSYRNQNGNFTVRYIGRLITAEADVKIKGKATKWLLGGHNASVIDAGGAMDNIMEDKIYDLTSCRISLFNPWGDARKKIAHFMSYDINHRIIEESLDDDNPRVIRNWLNNSVSEKYISDSMEALSNIFQRVKTINSWLFAILFAILPCVIAYFIRPVFIKLKPSDPVTFMNSIPYMIVSTAVLALSACLITWLLNKWYNAKDKDLVWSKQRNLMMKVPFTQNTSIAAGYSVEDSMRYGFYCATLTFPGIATYVWTLLTI